MNYQENPDSVHPTWRKYFDDLESGKRYDEHEYSRPTVVTSTRKAASATDANASHLAVSFLALIFECLVFYKPHVKVLTSFIFSSSHLRILYHQIHSVLLI